MKRDAIEELYDYTDFAWAMIAQTVRAMPAGSLTKPVSGSGWPSLREALQHVIGAYDDWLHATLRFGDAIGPAAETMITWDSFDTYRGAVRATFRRVLDDTPDKKLYERLTPIYDAEDGPESLSLADPPGR